MKKALAVVLLVLGSFLEVYYYYYRFTRDGTPGEIAIIIGLALNFLLMSVVIKKWWFLIIPLVIFSIVSTSSGQTFALMQKQEDENKALYVPEFSALENDSRIAREELEAINKQIAGTVTTLEDRYEWKNTLRLAEERKREIEARLAGNRGRVREIGTSEKKDRNESIYTFYARMGNGMCRADWLKFWLHTALSVFIAFMAPCGLAMLEQDRGEGAEDREAKKMSKDTWVRFMWRGMRKGSKGIPSADQMREYCYIAGIPFDLSKHEEYKKEAIEKALISPKTGLCVSQEYAQKKMKNN